MSWEIRQGDALTRLREMPAESVQCCITSPPYFGLRDYGTAKWEGGDEDCEHQKKDPAIAARRSTLGPKGDGLGADNHAHRVGAQYGQECGKCGATRIDSQLGLEPTPDDYVARLVEVFSEVRRVLRDDGTLWLNLGDSYNAYNGNRGESTSLSARADVARNLPARGLTVAAAKPKDLLGIPWLVAFALRADGWYLRSEIIWAKPNPMPESVQDRPTRAHEQVFLLTKGARYFYDADAVREPYEMSSWTAVADAAGTTRRGELGQRSGAKMAARAEGAADGQRSGATAMLNAYGHGGRNKRTVWTVATQPYAEAHFATFPPKLIEPMVLAGSASDDTILDPFAGAGTTGVVSLRHQRSFIGIELSEDYCELARNRIRDDEPLFNYVSEVAPQ